ncbi:SurA N-terminal domain-containing protein [Pelagirhabdus alkalitolerans]|uniref:SurA N-terminal domain-containing protein n=1 Tax=Pelagirhabdus alkalitolerans TaxID=1612202 RepID=A0A1G6L2F6_9BACI|nr:SurA N-terminal domain-containing protein [Pelagirhabdus alkalitolerans]SDC37520.1 SurA N-terminal domain-containing protein [Pelagirhabdus alkalitolerans]
MMKRSMATVVFLVLLIVGLTACIGDTEQDQQLEQNNETGELPEEVDEEMISSDELLDEDERVATVNGETIDGADYNAVYYELKSTRSSETFDGQALEAFQREVVDEVIRRRLLIQDAEERGIRVTEGEIENAYLDTRAQFETEDEFYQILDSLPYSSEHFREILAYSLIRQYYIEQEFSDIEITEQDVELFYELLEEQMDEAPPFNEIEGQLERELLENEIDRVINERLDRLEEEADITIYID